MAPSGLQLEDAWRDSHLNGSLRDFEHASLKINPPRVVFDNSSEPSATLVKVDSANRQGCLLQVVQLLTDLDLTISKAHISSDGGWFVDVFYVTDQNGSKISDTKIISYIQQTLGASNDKTSSSEVKTCTGKSAADAALSGQTAIELTGVDRPGLLYDVSAAISGMGCSVLAAEVWTHNNRFAFVIYITETTGEPLGNTEKLASIKAQLANMLELGRGSDLVSQAKLTDGATHTGRRLHQLMFADRDYEPRKAIADSCSLKEEAKLGRPVVNVRNSDEAGYTIINVQCPDRPKLLFDTVCTLTDMQYIIHHATIGSDMGVASQEYFVTSMDGFVLESEAEMNRVGQCLTAAIERRSPAGTRLELCAGDRVGLLADVTRAFRDNGISISSANVSTRNGKAVNEFFVVNERGGLVDQKVLDAVRKEIGPSLLFIRDPPSFAPGSPLRSDSGRFTLTERLLMSLGLAQASV